MTLNLIAGLPATTDIAGARVFPYKLDAVEVAETFNQRLASQTLSDEPNGSGVCVTVVTHYLQSGRRCWVLRQLGGARTVTKYVARIAVRDRAGKEIHADR